MPTFVDLSVAIDNNEHTDHPGGSPNITYRNHAETAGGLAHFFPGLQANDLPDSEGWAIETLTLSTHNGTHMDAPWHFHSTTDYGKIPRQRSMKRRSSTAFSPGLSSIFGISKTAIWLPPPTLNASLSVLGIHLSPWT